MRDYELSHADLVWALDVGVKRELHARRDGRKDTAQRVDPGESLFRHVNGAGGELALGRVLGIPWPALVDTYGSCPDYPDQGIEVKTASTRNRPLVIRRSVWARRKFDPFYFLVWGTIPTFTVVGYLSAGDLDAVLPGLKPDRNECKNVPWGVLSPLIGQTHRYG